MFDIITIGDAVFDIFIKPEDIFLERAPEKMQRSFYTEKEICFPFGEKLEVKEAHYDVGGSAVNTAIAFSRLGLKTGFIGMVGNDFYGKQIIDKMEKEGVNLRFVKTKKEIKTSFSIILSYRGERTILVHRGISDYGEISLPKALNTKWFFIGPLGFGWEKLYTKIIALSCTKNINIALNPGSFQIEEKNYSFLGMLKIVKVLFLNKEEAEKICNVKMVTPIKDLLFELKNMGPEIVVITDGPKGAYSFNGEEYLAINNYPAERKERTGAGDAFSSGCLTALTLDKDIKEALQWGVIDAASVIEQIGAQKGLLKKSQIEKKLKKGPRPRLI